MATTIISLSNLVKRSVARLMQLGKEQAQDTVSTDCSSNHLSYQALPHSYTYPICTHSLYIGIASFQVIGFFYREMLSVGLALIAVLPWISLDIPAYPAKVSLS